MLNKPFWLSSTQREEHHLQKSSEDILISKITMHALIVLADMSACTNGLEILAS